MAYTVINKPASYFNTVTYTGNGSTQSITGVNFKPDFVWIKGRTSLTNPRVYDIIRGATVELYPSLTNGDTTQVQSLTSFNSDGFSIGTLSPVNTNGDNYVSWNWLGANSTTTNTSGTITSTVSANTTSGFSIVSYTGNGTAGATVGHGLGVAPRMLIIKSRTNGTTNWKIYNASLGATKNGTFTTAAWDTEIYAWNNTAPTSSVFSLGTTPEVNQSSNTFIAYCFADVKGYSKFGSYTGNASTNGPFVYTGFKPAFVMIKNTTFASQYWQMIDNKRTPYNVSSTTGNFLFANSSDVEATSGNTVDFLSNGFKIRVAYDGTNYSGSTLIYMAFAENPFVSATAIPTTAR